MKEQGSDYVEYSTDNKPEPEQEPEQDQEPKRVLEKVKWVKMADWKKIAPHMPILREVRGMKKKLSVMIFQEISDSMQSVFERHKRFFRYRAQVDTMAYYVGARIIEEIYLELPGFFSSSISKLIEAREEEFQLYDDMKVVKEKFISDVEKFYEGLMEEEQLERLRNEYIAAFSPKNYPAAERLSKVFSEFSEKNLEMKMERILNEICESKESNKIRDKIRKREEYWRKAKEKGIEVVG